MIERDQSRETQVRMQNIGLVCKNTSRRSRNVHRVVQKPPTRVERFQTKPKTLLSPMNRMILDDILDFGAIWADDTFWFPFDQI